MCLSLVSSTAVAGMFHGCEQFYIPYEVGIRIGEFLTTQDQKITLVSKAAFEGAIEEKNRAKEKVLNSAGIFQQRQVGQETQASQATETNLSMSSTPSYCPAHPS